MSQLHLRALHDNARAHVGPGAGRLSPRLGSSRCRSGPEGRRQLPTRDRPRRSVGGNRRRRHVVRRMLVIRLHLQYVFHLHSSCWAGRKTNSVYFRASFIFFTTVVSNMRYCCLELCSVPRLLISNVSSVAGLPAGIDSDDAAAPPRRPALHHGADAVDGKARGGVRTEQGEVADAGHWKSFALDLIRFMF